MASSLRDQAARRRLELNPLTTSIQGFSGSHQTPASGVSGSSLSAPFGMYSPSIYSTPASSSRGYNPSQWTATSSVNSPQSHVSSRASQASQVSQDSDVAAAAPPPYSPPRSQFSTSEDLQSSPAQVQYQASPELSSSSSYGTASRPHTVYRATPEPVGNANYPPPPAGRSRTGSNDRSGIFHSPFSRRSNAAAGEPLRVSTSFNAWAQTPPVPRMPAQTSDTSYREIERNPQAQPAPQMVLPPAARRAVSTGSIGSPTAAARTGGSGPWPSSVPLPPPPPGPPPPHGRSQSMSRTTDPAPSPPTRRPVPMSSLETIPPSPAGYIDGFPVSLRRERVSAVESQGGSTHAESSSIESACESSATGLARAKAVRGESRSIRERRSESRNGRSVAPEAPVEASNNPWAEAITPSDIVVPPMTVLGRRPTVTKSTPRSGKSSNFSETPRSSHVTPSHQNAPSECSSATPHVLAQSARMEAPTPPVSGDPISKPSHIRSAPSPKPQALPTPPLHSSRIVDSPARLAGSDNIIAASSSRPASRQASRPASRSASRQSSRAGKMPQLSPADLFARSAAERHQAFIEKEASAASDGERVRVFADFIVSESRLRRERYASAIDSMGSEILELTRDLFRPYSSARRDSSVSRPDVWTPAESSSGPRSERGPTRTSSRDNMLTPSEDASSAPPSPLNPQDSSGWASFIPSLSPIPSMSVSEILDGSDSRGRPSSRWWEVSQLGSDGVPSQRFERSKRESKYMGVPKELREALQYAADDPSGSNAGPGSAGFAGDEYPPEKSGSDDVDITTPLPTPGKPTTPYSPQFTPNPDHLNVSRLVTLPPPYPRHHPAVKNDHPDLTSIRTRVRTLSDFTEIETAKALFLISSLAAREEATASAKKRRNSLRLTIQREIAAGTMTYAAAAARESEASTAETSKAKEAAKAEFELFQSQVVMPLNNELTERIVRASDLFSRLRAALFTDAQEANPNMTQEEGDEQPELLEKLTLLKWIFEAREQMYRELYEVLSDRNSRYRDMIIAPYLAAHNMDKVASATQFFADDAQKREAAFHAEILQRTEEFMDVVEANVVRGVEVQLSAFWDIAPSLSLLLHSVPEALEGFQIQIPRKEYEENEGYYEFPMKYLYSLLGHCGKSTYQFIESQINLLCLLHEVKVGVKKAEGRAERSRRVLAEEDTESVRVEVAQKQEREEGRLTDDLKEKVRCVEELWREGLGSELDGVKGRIEVFLGDRGEMVEDDDDE